MKGVIFILQMNQNDYGGPGLHIDEGWTVDEDKRHPGGFFGGFFSTSPCGGGPTSSLTKIKSHNHLRKIKYDKINMLIFFYM